MAISTPARSTSYLSENDLVDVGKPTTNDGQNLLSIVPQDDLVDAAITITNHGQHFYFL
jgi:hypothetical protein